jgi:hypothetical protein
MAASFSKVKQQQLELMKTNMVDTEWNLKPQLGIPNVRI